MTSLPANCIPVSNTSLPVAIDYPAALALRQMALVQDELPKYLLAPEVSALLHYVPDHATYVPPFLCDAHAVCRYTAEGPAESDGA